MLFVCIAILSSFLLLRRGTCAFAFVCTHSTAQQQGFLTNNSSYYDKSTSVCGLGLDWELLMLQLLSCLFFRVCLW